MLWLAVVAPCGRPRAFSVAVSVGFLEAVIAVQKEDEDDGERRAKCFKSDGNALSEQAIAYLTELTPPV